MRTAAIVIVAVLGIAHGAAAQNADDYRGGWRTDAGEAHTYQFSIRGDTVRGIYCTYCADATTLAFVDGTLGPDGLTFEVTHVKSDGSTAFKDTARARFANDTLIVTGTSGRPGGGRFERVLIKDPRGPDPLPVPVTTIPKSRSTPGTRVGGAAPRGGGVPGAAPGGGRGGYIQPGPWKAKLTERDVIGVWLGFGVGAPKQFFIIKKVGNRLRGMVCGTCDNTYTMAALDDFQIEGDTLRFKIIHEDWGDGDLATFDKHVAANVGWNEMRAVTSSTQPPPPPARTSGGVPGFSLQGPVAIEATAGNVWPEWPPKNTSSR
jgi:hypothetical protein